MPIFKQDNISSVSNYRPISLLNNFFKVFEFVAQYFKHKLNPTQQGFSTAKSTTTNLIAYHFLSPLVISQCQVDSIYFDLISASDLVSHTILLQNLCAHGLSDVCRIVL